MPVPKLYELFNPLLEVLRELGGSASIAELEEHVGQNLGMTVETVERTMEAGS